MRPYLHEFLTAAYEDYDIVIWSATGMRWIEEKMKLLGVSTHSDYKITFNMDSTAMISVHTTKRGVVDVKPLGVIWGKLDQYSSKNVCCDFLIFVEFWFNLRFCFLDNHV